jgi:hypothetical protein
MPKIRRNPLFLFAFPNDCQKLAREMLHISQRRDVRRISERHFRTTFNLNPISEANMSTTFTKKLGLTAAMTLSVLAFAGDAAATAFDGGLPAGWNCQGNCGTMNANGHVTTSPEGGAYAYVTTAGSQYTPDGLAIGSETNGSVLRSSLFSAAAGDDLEFYFNYVTSDSAQYVEYAWARLLNQDLSEAALLFNARTTDSGNTVPGFNLPGIAATIIPASTPIIAGTTWSALGAHSGTCYLNGPACGHTGWIKSLYDIATAGNYYLEFGVVNWLDTDFDSGMAIDGILIGGKPIDDDNQVPEPATLALLGLGLLGLGAMRRKAA